MRASSKRKELGKKVERTDKGGKPKEKVGSEEWQLPSRTEHKILIDLGN